MKKQSNSHKNSCLRKFLMLAHLPRAPAGGKLPSELAELLKDAGQEADLRTIQRDLKNLSLYFDLKIEKNGTSKRWSWDEHTSATSFPAMTKSEALALTLAELYIYELLPPELSSQLEARFQQAKEVLSSESSLKKWSDVAQILPRKVASLGPQPSEKILMDCYQALQKNRKLELTANDDPKSFNFSPEGILLDSGEMYLVGTYDNENDPRSISLGTLSKSTVLTKRASKIKDFRLSEYAEAFLNTTKSGSWLLEEFFISDIPTAGGTQLLKLRIKTRGRLTKHLSRHKFSRDQEIVELEDGWSEVQMTALNSRALRGWIFSWGEEIEVLGPQRLREEVYSSYCNLVDRYGHTDFH